MKYDAILFDLDGTLIDSAVDLFEALNKLLIRYDKPICSFEDIRPFVSYGSPKLLSLGFKDDYPLPYQAIRSEYLDIYEQQGIKNTRFFSGIIALLDTIEKRKTPWGIITNKPTHLTIPIAKALSLDKRADAIVCGDTLPVKKPDPSPIILACEMMGVNPKNCVYIGDCDRDIEAGKLAEMDTIACEYGYIAANDPIEKWGADFIAQTPEDIIDLIN